MLTPTAILPLIIWMGQGSNGYWLGGLVVLGLVILTLVLALASHVKKEAAP